MTENNSSSSSSSPPLQRVGAVSSDDLQRQLQRDQILRWLTLLGIPAASTIVLAWFDLTPDPLGFGIMIMAGTWMMLNFISARAWQQVSNMAELFAIDPEHAEARIAIVLQSKPLARQVRLLTWHRLATLRHQQKDFDQTIAVCQSVLMHPLRNAHPVRQHLLLMLTEAQLARGDAYGAYMSLSELSHQQLSLTHSLQKLALQTRYLLMVGYDEAALADLPGKVKMAELMPTLQCGAMHVLFYVAASRSGQTPQADWLHERSRLLLSQEQYDQIIQSLSMPTVTPGELL
ncbi:MAG: hypothetical protein ACF8OB_02425 [Phycisphaeraceae bacterium JB051]